MSDRTDRQAKRTAAVRLSPADYERAQRLAERDDRTLSYILRKAVAEGLPVVEARGEQRAGA